MIINLIVGICPHVFQEEKGDMQFPASMEGNLPAWTEPTPLRVHQSS